MLQAAALPSLPSLTGLPKLYAFCLPRPRPGRSSFLLSLVPGYLNIPVLPLNPLGGPFITSEPPEGHSGGSEFPALGEEGLSTDSQVH